MFPSSVHCRSFAAVCCRPQPPAAARNLSLHCWSYAASSHAGRKEPAPLYIGKTTSLANKILEASGVLRPTEPSRLSKRLDFPDKETLYTPTATPSTTTAPRMPHIHRPDPTPSTPVHVHSSSEVPHGPPPTLFMPPMVPTIPEVDDTGRPLTSSLISPTEAYIFVPWSENMIWRSARRSKGKLVDDLRCEADDLARLATPEEKKQKKKTRGPSKSPVLSSDGAVAYRRYIGVLIRDRVPMLWAEWKDVSMCVKESLNNAMSVWFDIPSSLLHTWCDEEQSTKYRSWKNELHLFWEAWGGERDACPIEFKYREHEWNWLCFHFNDPNYKYKKQD
ncbi:hypothetical protein OROGR_013593 [Orobanche gracilis]